MELRSHPTMTCDGLRVSPPKWFQTHGRRSTFVSGEIGILEFVFLSELTINKVYLIMSTEEHKFYLGGLMFEKATAAKAVFSLLQNNTHKSIASIAAIDLDERFGH